MNVEDLHIIGLTGPMQAGKNELQHVYADLGWEYFNLNWEPGDRIRAVGSPHREAFEALLPGELYDNGKKKATYYRLLAQVPGLLQCVLALELPHIRKALLKRCRRGGRVIVNWEYLHLLMRDFPAPIPIEHVIFMHPVQETIWFDRLRESAAQQDWARDALPSNKQLRAILAAAEVEPEKILPLWSGRDVTVIDPSDDDWGEAQFRSLFLERG